ncbi:hypothetical protein VCSRO184_2666 [Vibrio cholerae]|uniref:hypothetical protein n=1 Tax=Vibrio cholerae TaxID=666 RepID=UPI00204D8B87|nr:hypothetical protein [Vibrio cholerae]MDV2403611.1 hypothetical protein [Vibrio cholerae]BCN19162.1 hypothetical protein [Vibrio cholerae]GIB07192.1 hypothetical protein VCSRO184_2666 [Vibrio cholerae]
MLNNCFSFLLKIYFILRKPDSLSVFFKIENTDDYNVLLSCHDVGRSVKIKDAFQSPLILGLKFALKNENFKYYELSNPFSVTKKNDLPKNILSINFTVLIIKFFSYFISMLNKQDTLAVRADLEHYLYKILIRNLRIKIVFAIDPPWGLCKAAHVMGVKVIDLMHGNNYSIKDKIFSEKFNRAERYLPTDIIAFDECTYKTLKELTEKTDIRVFNSTNPWHNYCDHIINDIEYNINSSYKRKVLISLQWGYDGEREELSGIIDNGIIHKAILDIINENDDILFFIRLHPVQLVRPWYFKHRDFIHYLSKRYNNVECDYASSVPLKKLLCDVDLHISMSSSCTGEAADYMVPSLLLCPTLQYGGVNYGLFRELNEKDNKLVQFGTLNKEFISNWIENTPVRNSGVESNSSMDLSGFYLSFF